MLTCTQILDTITLLGEVSLNNLVCLYGKSAKSKDELRFAVHVLIGSNAIGFNIDSFLHSGNICLFVGKSR